MYEFILACRFFSLYNYDSYFDILCQDMILQLRITIVNICMNLSYLVGAFLLYNYDSYFDILCQ